MASAGASASDPGGVDALAARVEARVRAAAPLLRREDVGHYALVEDLQEADLLRAMAAVWFRSDGRAFVLGAGDVVEPHGGGILRLLFSHWRPAARAATAADAFYFQPNGRALALRALYEGHKLQVFLPPGPAPALPRLRFFAAEPEVPDVERDAFSFLQLLVEHEADYRAAWVNRAGQRVSVERLLQRAWDSYQLRRDALEREDHSPLHLVELLLAYRRGAAARGLGGPRLDLEALRARFLDVELARGDADDEALAHYAESLGLLVAEPGLCWDAGQRQRVGTWLDGVARHFADLERSDPGELTHLLRGLRLLRLHGARLAGREGCPQSSGA